MSNTYLARFKSNHAAFVAPEHSEVLTACLQALATSPDAAKLEQMSAEHDDFWPEQGSYLTRFRPYIVKDGVLQIPVKGVLLHDFPYQFSSLATGYEYIAKAMDRGLADGNVKGIAFLIDSPGGMVAGNFDLADKIFAARDVKPMRAFASESAYSAAYSIASAADKIVVARTGGVGSIGVVTAHIDISKMLDEAGYKITFIHAGKYKVDGNPYEPLPDDVKARIQSRIDELYSVFVSTVARNRGMDEQAVRDTEALTFTAGEAVSNGLADAIGSLDDAVGAFALELSINQGDEQMTKQNGDTVVDQAAVDAARAEGMAAGTKAGATAERERISAILALPEAANRRDSALTMALNSDLSVEQAGALLAKLPEENKAAAEEPKASDKSAALFNAAMANGNPEVGSGAEEDGGTDEVASIMQNYNAATGMVAKK